MHIENVYKMPAGREIDILVAEKVMGLSVVDDPNASLGVSIGQAGSNGFDLPRYSSNIDDAWKVVEKLKRPMKVVWTGRVWVCHIFDYDGPCEEADTAPLAICRAFLNASLARTK